MTQLSLYTVFHLNLAYSSIEESKHKEVMERCYWPLLRLARESQLPFGIEASGLTLETACSVDPKWVEELKALVQDGLLEFVGSGYAQIIGPLSPAQINRTNQEIGLEVYEQLLGIRPKIALVNEQAFSASLVGHYVDAGYKGIIMEWDNAYRYHHDWNAQWRYFPQIVCGQEGETLPLIWNESIAFQKFQRYAHGEIELDDYLAYLDGHLKANDGAFSLYSNDAEIFDFRPGRYQTEAILLEEGEWKRIGSLFETLKADTRFKLIRPGQVLKMLDRSGAGNRLHLESFEQPIPVKKQGKYNVTRWAVTGRDDLGINSACWRIFNVLKGKSVDTHKQQWKRLLKLFGSDYRTHITDTRWEAFLKDLCAFEKQIEAGSHSPNKPLVLDPADASLLKEAKQNGKYLELETDTIKVRLNCRRGLAIDALWLGDKEGTPLLGTLPHGYYDDILLGNDYYTGHLILESPGCAKVTDLGPVVPIVKRESNRICCSGRVETPLGHILKTITIDDSQQAVEISYCLNMHKIPLGSLRFLHLTLNPEAFDRNTLYYGTNNGGNGMERFPIGDGEVDHGGAVSFLVSAKHALGMTEGKAILGDAKRSLQVEFDKEEAAVVGLVTFKSLGDTYFYRLALSGRELDESSRNGRDVYEHGTKLFRMRIKGVLSPQVDGIVN